MSQYYFLVSSLPYLLPDTHTDLSVDKFLSDCESNMNEKDFAILSAALLEPSVADNAKAGNPFIKKWISWETSLRNELVKLRASSIKSDAGIYLRDGGEEAGLFETAREVVNISDPGEAEIRLNRIRWSFLDEMEAGHFFDLQKLLIYYLKLQILKRQESFIPDKGNEAYRKVYESVVEQIQA